jgi:hypothetical protein
MGLIGDIFQGVIGSNAAKNAANVQAQGSQSAQNLELENQTGALNFQNNVYDTTTKNEQPYLDVGSTAANKLQQLVSGTGFQAPTLAEAQQTPGFQFELGTGVDALDKSAAASGNLFSGTQGTALEQYGTGLADTTYNDAYNRALQTYMTNYNTLMGGAQLGESAAGTTGQLGQQAAFNTGQLDLTGGAQQAQQINNAAAARASGYIGSANAWNNSINNANNQMMEAAMLAGA